MKRVIIKLMSVALFVATSMVLSSHTTKAKEVYPPKVKIHVIEDNLDLPKVFLIGEYAEEFDAASAEYKLPLLEACNQDMRQAYFKWLSMLQEMEDYAEALEFEIKGVKMWIKVFWDKDGTVDHIAYYLKPNSRNVNVDELSAFFSSFINQYTFPLVTEQKFSNYGSASFPVVARRKTNEN